MSSKAVFPTDRIFRHPSMLAGTRAPASVQKSAKGRQKPRENAIPAYVRATGQNLSAEDRAYIRGKLGRALGKFSAAIVRVSVRIEDVNGPRGGVDRVCRIKVVLGGLPSVVFEQRDAALNAAVDGAIAGVEQAVRRVVRRRWTRPRRSAAERSSGFDEEAHQNEDS